jgi:MFS family permease
MIVGGRVKLTTAGRALHHRNYRLFFFGQLVSVTGTWMQTVAQGWLLGTLVGWDKAVVYIGLLGVVQSLPVLFLGLFGGIIADIWPKQRTVVGTQLTLGLLALTLGLLAYFHLVVVWHVFVLGFLLGLINVVDMPTRQAFVMEMVGGDDVANAVALNSAVFNGARIVGPAIAGVLIGLVGTALCFVLNALSYGAVVVSLLAMHERELMPAPRLEMPRNLTAVRSNLGEGLGYVRTTPLVLLVLAVGGFVNVFGLNFNVILPVMAASVLNVGSSGYGFLSAAMGAGALIAALAIATMDRPRLRVLIGGGIVLGVAELALASTKSYPVALAAVFIAGVGAIATSASANSLIQITVPGPLRGRVMSVWMTVWAGSTPIGNGLTGGVGGLLGMPVTLAMGGAMVLAAEAMAAAAVLRGYVRTGGGRGGGATLERMLEHRPKDVSEQEAVLKLPTICQPVATGDAPLCDGSAKSEVAR